MCKESRNAIRVHFENNLTYEELRNKVREEEFEVKLLKDKERHKIGNVSQLRVDTDVCQSSDLKQQIMRKIDSLDRKLEDLIKERLADRQIINNIATNTSSKY
ncbi:hypothetical protein DPMN_108345 [Dreissena polymorpha]|uniref:Uncharacterized protein n=1 Tax=Dreissena polymorpha TaxID=45954 RepID=A0A9D4K8Q7_DREPO|nr:hypothetical protein DPMN_108345 [Dreissena polymorpha]